MILKPLRFFGLFALLGLALGAAPSLARAGSCEVPLRNVMVDRGDCQYYVTAFRMMATRKISVDAVCAPATLKGPGNARYNAQVITTLTVHDSSCKQVKPLALNPVLLSRANCTGLEKVVAMLGTDFVDVKPACRYGSWVGADGNPRTSMVATRMALKTKATQKIAQK